MKARLFMHGSYLKTEEVNGWRQFIDVAFMPPLDIATIVDENAPIEAPKPNKLKFEYVSQDIWVFVKGG